MRHVFPFVYLVYHEYTVAQSARAVEYTDYFSAERYPPQPNVCSGYDIKQSDGDVPVMLEVWEMRNTPSLPRLPGSTQLGSNKTKLCTYAKLNYLK